MANPSSGIGGIRRSHLVGTYGPGAIIDFRAPGSGAPISGVLGGLEAWDESAGPLPGLLHSQKIYEKRLQEHLRVKGFRLPPIRLKEDLAPSIDVLPVVRFPNWLLCPKCSRLARAGDWSRIHPASPERFCTCDEHEKTWVVPVRFIVACEQGHLDEFPWAAWIGCHCKTPRFSLETRGPGLRGKVLVCKNSGCESKPTSLEGAFGKNALIERHLRCRGRRPWLSGDAGEVCDAVPRVLQRGASNVYWAHTLSALDIPPFSSSLGQILGQYGWHFEQSDPVEWPALIDLLRLDRMTGLPKEVLLKRLQEWAIAVEGEKANQGLEWAEYQKFMQANADTPEFSIEPAQVPAELGHQVASVVLAKRLREVRAMDGFTRIHPPSGPFSAPPKHLNRFPTEAEWLPAIELRGEGIFLRFDLDALRSWEARSPVAARGAELKAQLLSDLREGEEPPDCTPRFLMVHSFAHMLMRQLSLECGYSSSALRERTYVGAAPFDMAGVLIHTGSPDSEGTLGGLVRQGHVDLLAQTILQGLASMQWCSSDPLCITNAVSLSSPRNGAACHACLLMPETSCQHFNQRLDRALLIGTPDDPSIGFFHGVL